MKGPSSYRNYSRRARWIAWAMDAVASPLRPALRAIAPGRAAPGPPRSMLVVRLDHLGDVLMSTPAIAALKHAYPEARLDVLAAPWGRAALLGNPHVGRVIEVPAPWYDPRRGDLPAPAELVRVSARLRRERYDWSFDLRGDPRVVLAFLLPSAGRRFGFSGLGLEALLTDAVPYARDRSMLDLALDLARLAGAPSVGRRPVFVPGEGASRTADALLASAQVEAGSAFAVVAPSSNRAEARWMPERFAAVGDGLADRGLRVVLAGRASDAPVTARVAEAMRGRPVDLTGRTDLTVLAAILGRASMLVANDSGTSHLAAAMDCPTIAVFGPTDPALTFPYEDGERFLSVSAPIDHPRPCFDLGCDSDHGFSRIPAQHVLEACSRVLDRQPGRAIGIC